MAFRVLRLQGVEGRWGSGVRDYRLTSCKHAGAPSPSPSLGSLASQLQTAQSSLSLSDTCTDRYLSLRADLGEGACPGHCKAPNCDNQKPSLDICECPLGHRQQQQRFSENRRHI